MPAALGFLSRLYGNVACEAESFTVDVSAIVQLPLSQLNENGGRTYVSFEGLHNSSVRAEIATETAGCGRQDTARSSDRL